MQSINLNKVLDGGLASHKITPRASRSGATVLPAESKRGLFKVPHTDVDAGLALVA